MLDILMYILLIFVVLCMGLSFRFILRKLQDDYDNTTYAIESNGIIYLKVDSNGIIQEANSVFFQITGYSEEESGTLKFNDLVTEESKDELPGIYERLAEKEFAKTQLIMHLRNGECRAVNWSVKTLGNYKNSKKTYLFIGGNKSDEETYRKTLDESLAAIRRLYSEIEDYENTISLNSEQLHESEKKLTELKNKHNFILESVNIGICEYDFRKKDLYFTENCKTIFGLNPNKTVNEQFEELLTRLSPDSYFTMLEGLYNDIKNANRTFSYPMHIRERFSSAHKWVEFSGQFYFDENGSFQGIAGSFFDSTANKDYAENIESFAFFDSLTGLRNRAYMERFANRYISENADKISALVLIDADDFNSINNSLGQSFGDKILVDAAKRIEAMSPGYVVSRFNCGQMAVFVPDSEAIENGIESYLQGLISALSAIYSDNDTSCRISFSIGVSLSPSNGSSLGALLHCANTAMNEAKNTDKNKIIFYDESMNKQLIDRINIENDLRYALETSTQLLVYLQPQYYIKSGELRGFEALARWRHSVKGFVSPVEFIHLAEETRLMMPLGRWVFYESCRHIKKLEAIGYSNLQVSVNLSPVQMMDDMFISYVEDVIEHTQINPKMLVLELTENNVIENIDNSKRKLKELVDLGIKISLDNFGTGFSSITYLKTLPISVLKIDRSIVADITKIEVERQIVKEIINLAHILKIEAIVEGIDTTEQLGIVKETGCDAVQGFLSGRPAPFEQIVHILDKKLME